MRSEANDRKNIFKAQPGEKASCDQLGLMFCENTHIFLTTELPQGILHGRQNGQQGILLFGVPQGRRSSFIACLSNSLTFVH